MNQPLMLTATQKAGPKVTLAVGAVLLILLRVISAEEARSEA